MKKNLMFIFVSIMCLFLFSEEIKGKYFSEDGYINFYDTSYELNLKDYISDITRNEKGEYKLQKDEYGNNILCLNSNSNLKYIYRIFFVNDFIFLYQEEIPFFIGNMKSSRLLESLIPVKINSSSFLVEPNKTYKPDKLTYWGNLNFIWAEGAEGNGIGEKLFLEKSQLSKLYILPGYVSISRPDLYGKNSRPKKIRICTENEVFYFNIQDIPIFQEFTFPKTIDSSIEIEILEVYEGTIYQDMCISSILCRR